MKKDINGFSVQDYLQGYATQQMWFAIFVLANIMVFVMYGQRVNKAIKGNDSTPNKFHLWYFVTHNILDLIRTEAAIYLIARASLIIIDVKFVVALAIFIGLISDRLIYIFQFIKEQGIIRIITEVKTRFGSSGQKQSETTTTTITGPAPQPAKEKDPDQ